MDDDLSTPQALAMMFEQKTKADSYTIASLLYHLGFDLTLGSESATNSQESGKSSQVLANLVDKLLREREEARANKNFSRSDEIRDQLQEAGVQIKDSRDKPSEWFL